MKKKRITATVIQSLELEGDAKIEKCPDKEFSYLDCIKIGDEYFLPSIQWTKFNSANTASGDDSGSFDPIDGSDWETLHHAITDEQTRIQNS